MEHIPTPWKSEKGNIKFLTHSKWHTICRMNTAKLNPEGCKENAAFIVQCVNNHDELVEALEALLTDWHFQMNAYKEMPVETRARAILDKIEKGG